MIKSFWKLKIFSTLCLYLQRTFWFCIWHSTIFLDKLPCSTFPCTIIILAYSTTIVIFHAYIKRLLFRVISYFKCESFILGQIFGDEFFHLFWPIEGGYSANHPSTNSQFSRVGRVTVGSVIAVIRSVVVGSTGPWKFPYLIYTEIKK